MPKSPYDGVAIAGWESVTRSLIQKYPLKMTEVVEVVKLAWSDIFASGFGKKQFKIGKDIFPKPQIMAFLLHELIPLELATRYPNVWSPERTAADKDIVYLPDDAFSTEFKCSSHKSKIFGNRSYAQQGKDGAESRKKKSKDGYFLQVNFDKCDKKTAKPSIRQVKFGWLDHTDWRGQTEATGQQANLSADVEKFKLLSLYPQSQV